MRSHLNRPSRIAVIVLTVAAMAALAAGPPASPGRSGEAPGKPSDGTAPEPPFDYIAQAEELSQPEYEIGTMGAEVPMPDGETLYVEVTLPDPAQFEDGPKEWPVIMEASPYHGTLADRQGIRIFPDPKDEEGNRLGLTHYFAPRGYAVVMVDLRGTGGSSGCLDHLGPKDAADLKAIVEWAADRSWSNGKVGMTGHSYVGSTPSIAAAQDPDGLVTIAPSAGLVSMYDHQYQRGVPYAFQWVGPMFAYEQLALERDLPGGEHFGERPEQTGCGLANSSLTAGQGQVTGQYQAWHAQRDWREAAAAADLPVFMIHGVNDNAARIPAAEWFFADRAPRADDKVWIGQWDHGSAGFTRCDEAESVGHVNCRFDQWKYALHAWFDHHLKGMDVETGPTVEAFLNGEQVTTADRWDASPGRMTLYPDASDGSLALTPPEDAGAAGFTAVAGDGSVEFASAPATEETVFVGMPELRLDVSTVSSQALHVVATLFAEDGEGERRPMNTCATNTHLRHGVATPAPVVPGEVMALDLQCFTMAHRLAEGEHMVLSVGTTSAHHVPTLATEVQATVHTGPDASAYALPLDADAPLFDDVERFEDADEQFPVGPAQAPIEGSVVVPAPGAGVIVDPVTAATFTFTVADQYDPEAGTGADNAALDVLATPLTPADIDLYLQRQNDDGSCSGEDVASGASGDIEKETLTATRPAPGDYCLIVHNWAGGPNQVELTLTFTNSDGEPGS